MDLRQRLYPVKTTALNLACRAITPLNDFNPENNFLIFSYPRSGSTWLMELIRTVPGTVSLWEPLHIRNVKPFREIGFGWRQYIPEEAEWKEAEERFRQLFRGKYLNFWLSSRDYPWRFCRSERMVIKFVRANALLPWLTRKFTFQFKPLYLIRHPFAVAASQIKEGSWDGSFEGVEIPNTRFNEIYKQHASFLTTLHTKPEGMVALWCINNKVVLESSRKNRDWITLCYENLLLNPEQVLAAVFDQWKLPVPEGILEKVRKASSTTMESTFQKSRQAQLSKWRRVFNQKQVSKMKRVLDYFDMDIYSEELLPKAGIVEGRQI